MTSRLRQRVIDLLDYDPETGHFRWKQARGRASIGMIAGRRQSQGYVQIRIDRQVHYAHRLAWLVVNGGFPKDQIDHINLVKSDNRICNLRQVSQTVNLQNRKNAQRNSKTGLLGVDFDRGKYRAQIQAGGRHKLLGRFPTPELAYDAYIRAKRELHEGNTL